MGFITLQTPVIGNPNSTEAPKVDSNFIALSSLLNGSLDTNNLSSSAGVTDTQLASPNSARRSVVFGTMATLTNMSWVISGQGFIMPLVGNPLASGGTTALGVPTWASDTGIQGAPLDYTIPNKTSKMRIRCTVVANAVTPGVNIAVFLAQISSLGATAGSIAYNFAALSGTLGTAVGITGGVATGLESSEFATPTDGFTYGLGLSLSGGSGSQAAGSVVTCTSMLLYYGV